MRSIGWLLLILVALGWLASALPPPATRPSAEAEARVAIEGVRVERDWRRTRDGWERSSRWALPTRQRPPALHPALIALLEVLLALAAMIAFEGHSQALSSRRADQILDPNGK